MFTVPVRNPFPLAPRNSAVPVKAGPRLIGASLNRTQDVVAEAGRRVRGVAGVDATVEVAGINAATFSPAGVRRSAKRHALHTEASHRFERGTDVGAVPQVLDRAAQLIAELGVASLAPNRLENALCLGCQFITLSSSI